MSDSFRDGLGPRGRKLWDELNELKTFNAGERTILEEACRTADRLEQLDVILRGDDTVWARLVHNVRTEDYELKIDAALVEARQQQNVLKQMIVSLRLPDVATGARTQHRGARGAYQKGSPAKVVSSLEQARKAHKGA